MGKLIIEKKNIILTGGLGLLGSSIYKHLRECGHKVFILDIKPKDQSFIIPPDQFFNLDVSNEKDFQKTLKIILKKEKIIHGLINCIYPKTPDWNTGLELFSSKSFKENVATHLSGYFIPMRCLAEFMKKEQIAGSIINISSVYSTIAPDPKLYKGTDKKLACPYPSIKSGIHSLSTYFASYYGDFNIRVNTISPGPILNKQDKKIIKRYIEKTPLRRLGKPSDINGCVEFLLSDTASFITGQNIVIDGGLSII